MSWGNEEENIDELLDFTVPDEAVTTRVPIVPALPLMRRAMQAHRTQIAQDDPFMSMPEEVGAQVMGEGTFTRARSLVEAPLPETDLFAGLR